MGRLVSLALMLLAGILVYNYFFGSETEKEQSKKVFQITKDLGKQIKEVVKSEKDSYNDGKYKSIVDKIRGVIKSDDELSDKYSSQLDEIQEVQDKLELVQRKKERKSTKYDKDEEEELEKKLEKLLQELSDDLEK